CSTCPASSCTACGAQASGPAPGSGATPAPKPTSSSPTVEPSSAASPTMGGCCRRSASPEAWGRRSPATSPRDRARLSAKARGDHMKLLAGNSNKVLAQAVAEHLDLPLTRAQVKRFADNEVWVTIDENVRGEDVFVLQSTNYPA